MKKIFLNEEPISIHDLPPPTVSRWSMYAKARVVVGIRKKLLTLEDAVLYYGIEPFEFLDWRHLYEKEGLLGLRTSHIQAYRLKHERKEPSLYERPLPAPARQASLWKRDSEIRLGPLTLVYKRHGTKSEVLYFHRLVPLSQSSTEILALLLKHRRRVVTKFEILKHLYGAEYGRFDRKGIDVFVNRMRDVFQKIDPSLTRDAIVVAVWGRGYTLSPQFIRKYC